MTQNTVFQYVKNNFLLSQKKLVFFTILNLTIPDPVDSAGIGVVMVLVLVQAASVGQKPI